MRSRTQKQPQVKKEPCRVLDDVDLDDVDRMCNEGGSRASAMINYKKLIWRHCVTEPELSF